MHSQDALSANRKEMCSKQSEGAEFICTIFFFFFLIPLVLALKQLFKPKTSCYAHFRLSNRDGTRSLGLVWECPFVNLFSSHFGGHYFTAYAVGKALHLVVLFIAVLKNSLLTALVTLGWS